jgi:hypothetical protein
MNIAMIDGIISKRPLLIALLYAVHAALFTSCQFSEECNYTGDVEIVIDWDALWGDIQSPESMGLAFIQDKSMTYKELRGDTVYTGIPWGKTRLFACNGLEKMLSLGAAISADGELTLPTRFNGNTRVVSECPMICAFKDWIDVPIDDRIREVVSPEPIVKQLYFIINLIKDGQNVGDVTSCEASLSGISTAYNFHKEAPVRSKGTFPFKLKQSTRTNAIAVDDRYSSQFYVLGVNATQVGEEPIRKKLSVTVTLDNGEIKSEEVDITPELDKFNTNIFKCELTLRISTTDMNVSIGNWEQGAWGEIVIQ